MTKEEKETIRNAIQEIKKEEASLTDNSEMIESLLASNQRIQNRMMQELYKLMYYLDYNTN